MGIFENIDRQGDKYILQNNLAQNHRVQKVAAIELRPAHVEEPSWCTEADDPEGHSQDVHNAIEASLPLVQSEEPAVQKFLSAVAQHLVDSGWTPQQVQAIISDVEDIAEAQALYYGGLS